jgi:hypothetical protein
VHASWLEQSEQMSISFERREAGLDLVAIIIVPSRARSAAIQSRGQCAIRCDKEIDMPASCLFAVLLFGQQDSFLCARIGEGGKDMGLLAYMLTAGGFIAYQILVIDACGTTFRVFFRGEVRPTLIILFMDFFPLELLRL